MIYAYLKGGVTAMSVTVSKSEYFANLQRLIQSNTDTSPAANAIRSSIQALIDFQLCTLDEFLCLVDLDYKNDWPIIAGEIARKAEEEIRLGQLHPNDIKPWQNCDDYSAEFEKIVDQKEWRELHSALDTIIQCVSARFRGGS